MQQFDNWNQTKKKIERKKRIYFHIREIWFIKIGKNIGDEQDGKGENFLRPVLILKKFNKNIFLGIPLTSSSKKGKFYFNFQFLEDIKSIAILSQIRLFDAKRLAYCKGKIKNKDFKNLKKKLCKVITEPF